MKIKKIIYGFIGVSGLVSLIGLFGDPIGYPIVNNIVMYVVPIGALNWLPVALKRDNKDIFSMIGIK